MFLLMLTSAAMLQGKAEPRYGSAATTLPLHLAAVLGLAAGALGRCWSGALLVSGAVAVAVAMAVAVPRCKHVPDHDLSY